MESPRTLFGRLLALISAFNHFDAILMDGSYHKVFSAKFSPDGKSVVTASGDGSARVWNAETGELVAWLGHQAAVYSASFSPDNRWVVTASADHTARVWDARTGQPISPPLQHLDQVYSAEFSPDGQWVVTASFDHTARIWDARTGQPISTPLENQDSVVSASFSPDAKCVVTASGLIARVWDIAPSTAPPAWLPDILEAQAFERLDNGGTLKVNSTDSYNRIQAERMAPTSDTAWDNFAKWAFSDPEARTISPWASLTGPEYIQRLIAEGSSDSLDQAERLSIGHPKELEQIASKRSELTQVR